MTRNIVISQKYIFNVTKHYSCVNALNILIMTYLLFIHTWNILHYLKK